MIKPKISVVTVVYNSLQSIQRTIKSITSQTYDQVEYIIIDGGSSDGTLTIINAYKKSINLFISEPDNGIYDAMNKALDLASGDFLIFINSGDTFVNQSVLEMAAGKFSDPHSVYFGNSIFIDQKLKTEYIYQVQSKKFSMAFHNICHQTIFYPKVVYKSERYNLKYKLFADWEYNLRLIGKDIEFKFINQTISFFELGGLSSNQDLEFLRDRGKIIRSNLGLLVFVYFIIKEKFRPRQWFGLKS